MRADRSSFGYGHDDPCAYISEVSIGEIFDFLLGLEANAVHGELVYQLFQLGLLLSVVVAEVLIGALLDSFAELVQ